jgi:transposase
VLSVDEVRNAIADPAAGGEVLFIGTVRDNDADKGVIGLAYSAHPSAEAELRKVTEGIVAKFPDVIGVAAVHRVGDLDVGDLAVVVPEHAFILQMMLDGIDHLTAQIAVLDEKIAVLCEPYERQIAQLDGNPGFGITAAQDLIAEIGVDMSAFPTAGHLVSWARQAPRVSQSAGKRKGKNATGRGNPYIGGTLGETAVSAGRTPDFPRRQVPAHVQAHGEEESPGRLHEEPARHRHAFLSDPEAECQDLGSDYYEQRAGARRQAGSHIRGLERLGYRVTIEPVDPGADPETGELITRTAS